MRFHLVDARRFLTRCLSTAKELTDESGMNKIYIQMLLLRDLNAILALRVFCFFVCLLLFDQWGWSKTRRSRSDTSVSFSLRRSARQHTSPVEIINKTAAVRRLGVD